MNIFANYDENLKKTMFWVKIWPFSPILSIIFKKISNISGGGGPGPRSPPGIPPGFLAVESWLFSEVLFLEFLDCDFAFYNLSMYVDTLAYTWCNMNRISLLQWA